MLYHCSFHPSYHNDHYLSVFPTMTQPAKIIHGSHMEETQCSNSNMLSKYVSSKWHARARNMALAVNLTHGHRECLGTRC